MSEWLNEEDFLDDLDLLSDFKDDENSAEIEVNHNTFMDDDDSNDKIKEEICDINKPSHSDRDMMDQAALEVTEGLKLAGCLREDEGAFFKLKMEQQSSTTKNIAKQQHAFTKMEHQSTNIKMEQQSTAVSLDSSPRNHKSKRNKFRPLVEPSGFTRVSKNDWMPVREDQPLDINNFPKLK